MKKFVAGMLFGVCVLSVAVGYAGQGATCEEKLRQTASMLDITRGGRDQAEQALAELFTRYQDALKQVEDLKAKLPKEGK